MADNPTSELLQALNQFQQATISAYKDSKGYGYTYASEESINDTLRPAKALGLTHAVTMHPMGPEVDGRPSQTEIRLRVFHAASGGYLESAMVIDDYDPNNKKDARHQQRGSAISYAKRYMLPALFGLATSDDAGEKMEESEEPAKPKAKAKPNTLPQQQSIAKPKADPLADRKEACKAELGAAWKKDNDVLDLWRQALKLRFNGNITADKPTIANLSTDEQVTWCEEWISQYKAQTKAKA
nr:ERF family protein [uncultured Mediterranean phage uvMED]